MKGGVKRRRLQEGFWRCLGSSENKQVVASQRRQTRSEGIHEGRKKRIL